MISISLMSVLFFTPDITIHKQRGIHLSISKHAPPPPSLTAAAIATLCAARVASAARRSAASRFGACTVKGSSVGMATLGAMV